VSVISGCDTNSKPAVQESTTSLPVAQAATDVQSETVYQRGIEAAVWAMPAMSMEFFWDGAFRDFKMGYNDVMAMSKPAEQHHKLLTANNVTPYIAFSLNLAQDAAVVVEIPPAGEKAVLYGNIVGAWQYEIAAVGPSGLDEGKGGKYLFLPPDFKGDVPSGYLVVKSPTYSVTAALRSISVGGGTDEDAHAYAKGVKIYPLSEATNPPATRFVDASPLPWDSLPKFDLSYYEKMANFVNREPVNEYDKVMMGMLESIGIVKGEEFNPDAKTKAALEKAIVAAKVRMEHWWQTKTYQPYWDGSGWKLMVTDPNKINGFTYVTDEAVWVDDRAGGLFYWGTYVPKELGKGTFYLMGMLDADGSPLKADGNYKLTVQKDIPAKQFWSVIAYGMDDKAFITTKANRPGLSSYDLPNMKTNADGSVDLYFGKDAPAGQESNWIPTGGKDFFLIFRFYGPEEPLFKKTFRLNEVQKVE